MKEQIEKRYRGGANGALARLQLRRSGGLNSIPTQTIINTAVDPPKPTQDNVETERSLTSRSTLPVVDGVPVPAQATTSNATAAGTSSSDQDFTATTGTVVTTTTQPDSEVSDADKARQNVSQPWRLMQQFVNQGRTNDTSTDDTVALRKLAVLFCMFIALLTRTGDSEASATSFYIKNIKTSY